jgi:hypothetical protein
VIKKNLGSFFDEITIATREISIKRGRRWNCMCACQPAVGLVGSEINKNIFSLI